MIQHFRSASTYVKQRKFGELLLRSKLLARQTYDSIRYDAASKLSRDKYRLVRTNGYRMYVHLEDRGISKDLFLYGSRERFACQVLKTLLKEDDVVLDIGANIGYYTLLENEKASRGHVFACEPSPFNRELLQRNLALNNAGRVRVFPFAFGDESKRARPFYIYDKSNWASFNNELGRKILKTIWVETVSIDDFTNRYLDGLLPTVMRMDVEGYEHEIIKGAQNVLARCRNLKIFMEIHPHLLTDRELDGMLETLRVNGFQVRAIVNECEPHVYQFLHEKVWSRMQAVPYGVIGNSYEQLRAYLAASTGTEVFFEKTT